MPKRDLCHIATLAVARGEDGAAERDFPRSEVAVRVLLAEEGRGDAANAAGSLIRIGAAGLVVARERTACAIADAGRAAAAYLSSLDGRVDISNSLQHVSALQDVGRGYWDRDRDLIAPCLASAFHALTIFTLSQLRADLWKK